MRSSVRAVEADELLPFLVGRGEHEVGATRRSRASTRGRMVGFVVETGFGLDARERVERGDEREVELVLQPVSDRARDPVVGVQYVVGGGRRSR